MPTLTAGQPTSFFVPLDSTITVTPATTVGAHVTLSGRGPNGEAVTPRVMYSAESVALTAGSTCTLTARGGDGSYTSPALTASDVEALAALVSEDRITTWANRAALVTAGLTNAFFTDVGIGGSYWDYQAGRWRPQARRVMLKNSITDVTNNGAAEVVLDYATLLPGLWQDGDILEVGFRKSRTGGTSDTDASLLKIGSVAATPGTITGLGSAAALATTTIELTMKGLRLRRLTNTSFRPLNIPGAVGVGGGTSAIADVTGFANMDNATAYLQICSDLTTAGGEVSVLRSFTVELIAGA